MAAISSMQIGKAIQDALGFPAETNLIQIRLGLDEPVEVLCRYYPSAEAMERVLHVLQASHCIPVGEPSVIDDTQEPLHPGAAHSRERPQEPQIGRRR